MQIENSKAESWNSTYTNGMKYRQFESVDVYNFIKNKFIYGDVLDIGCGAGEFSIELAQQGLNVTGVDISDVAIEKAKANAMIANVKVEFIVGDINTVTNLNNNVTPKNTFDTITCKLVYAFIENKEDFIHKVKDLLKDGGTFFISTPVITEENKDKVLKPKICINLNDIDNLKKHFVNVRADKIKENAFGDDYVIVCIDR